MGVHIQLAAALALGTIFVCLIGAWARRDKLARWGLILCGIMVATAAYPTMAEMLARPKPVDEEWFRREAAEALVTGVYVDEGVALYLYLVLPGLAEPRSYSFPWSDETRELAQKLQEMLGSEEGANGVMIPYPFEPSLEREEPLTPHAVPQPAMPEKEQPQPPVHYRAARYEIVEAPWWWSLWI